MTKLVGVSTLLVVASLTVGASAAAGHKGTAPSMEHKNAIGATKPKTTIYNFEAMKAGSSPSGFMLAKTGGGPDGRWVVESEKGAPSGKNVLAQTDTNPTGDRMLTAVANEPVARDLTLSVRSKVVSGKVGEDAGLVFRYRDDNNYYVARADALKHEVILSAVKDGKSTDIAVHKGTVNKGAWHTLAVVARGDHLQVLWNGAPVINAHDKTFSEPGKIGVFTQGDSVTYYDNLRITRLG